MTITAASRKGEVVFRSDNMSTVSVLREVLSKETALKKVAVRITHGEPYEKKFVLCGVNVSVCCDCCRVG